MTLVEFIAPLYKSSRQDQILAVLYFKQKYEKANVLTVQQTRQALRQARVQGWNKVNIADILAKSGPYVDTPGMEGRKRLWCLTPSGVRHVEELLGLPSPKPETKHDISSLDKLINSISDSYVIDYVEEALKCLKVDALRATVVFLWIGAIRTIQTRLLSVGHAPLNAALVKYDSKARTVKKIDDFAYIKDKVTLLAAKELGLYDKTEKDTLQEALDLRNRCGHPGKYKPGMKKASSFVEDIVSIVFK